MKAKINLKNIKGYLQAHYRQVLDEFDYLESHIKEQAEWRLYQVKKYSPECYNSDKCIHCGCQVSSKVFEDRACEGRCYPEMMSKERWELHLSVPEATTNPFNETIFDKEKVKGTATTIPITSGPIIVRDFSVGQETLADLMQNNPHLTKEELLYWCPEFKEDLPGKGGTQFKIKLSKDQFSGNMTPEQIKDIANEYKDYL